MIVAAHKERLGIYIAASDSYHNTVVSQELVKEISTATPIVEGASYVLHWFSSDCRKYSNGWSERLARSVFSSTSALPLSGFIVNRRKPE